jgi:adenylyltransferase/sulfurtransferase
MALSEIEKTRYLRNLILPEISEQGQEKLFQAKVLVVGAGGIGSSTLFYLAAAGVGEIGIIDDDIVELSNLQRQVIHNQENLGQKKVESAKQKILLLNDKTKVDIFYFKAELKNLKIILPKYDLIVDATDNFQTRFVINQASFLMKKPLIFAAVKAFSGQVSVFKSYQKNNPCYACFNPNIIDKNFALPISEKGILGSVAGSIGAIQATTTIKEILQIGDSLVGKILFYDFLENNYRKVKLNKKPSCKICGSK